MRHIRPFPMPHEPSVVNGNSFSGLVEFVELDVLEGMVPLEVLVELTANVALAEADAEADAEAVPSGLVMKVKVVLEVAVLSVALLSAALLAAAVASLVVV